MTPSVVYSCLLSIQFDWAEDKEVNGVSGKVSRKQQSFMYITSQYNKAECTEEDETPYPFRVVDTRLKVRGSGRVAVLRYESETGKDFELLGHTTPFTVEAEG